MKALLVSGDEVQQVALAGFDHLAVRDDFDLVVGGAHEGAGEDEPHEGVAPEALTAHHGFEQEAQGWPWVSLR